MTPAAQQGQRIGRGVTSQHRVAMVLIGVALAARLARDSRIYEHVIMVVIGVAAATSLGRHHGARSVARLAAWDKRRNLNDQRAPKTRQA